MGRPKGSKNKSRLTAKQKKEFSQGKAKITQKGVKEVSQDFINKKAPTKIISQQNIDIIEEDLIPRHAKFGSPSSMSRTEKCPAWLAFGKDIPNTESTEYSLEGDEFHKYLAKCGLLYLNKAKNNLIEDILKDIPARYPDMNGYIWTSLSKLNNLWELFKSKHYNCQVYFEVKIKVNDDIWGTSDLVFTGKNKKTGKTDVVCIDWKYGQGVRVQAEESRQGITYLLGAIESLNLTNIGICIIIIAQVRLDEDWEENRYVIRDSEELQEWKENIISWVDKAKEIYAGNLPIKGNMSAGDHCRFCKCAPKCPEQKRVHFDKLAPIIQSATELPIGNEQKEKLAKSVKKLTLDEQVEIFKKKSLIEDFVAAVAGNLYKAFDTGITHPDLKMIRTNGRRKWRTDLDDGLIAQKLIKKGLKNPWEKKLIALTTAEKEVGDISKLVEMGEGRKELVLRSDKRRAVEVIEAEEREI